MVHYNGFHTPEIGMRRTEVYFMLSATASLIRWNGMYA
jgi:hypothetical protein